MKKWEWNSILFQMEVCRHILFEDVTYISKDNKIDRYPTQNQKELNKAVYLASTNEGDTVADYYYLGSGTTCEVALELRQEIHGV